MRFIAFDRMIRGLNYPGRGATARWVKFPDTEGPPTDLTYGKKIFALKKDCTINPHGRVNMVTSRLVLRGALHLRNFDRLEQHRDYLLIQPTAACIMHPGDDTPVSERRNNVRWVTALTETAYTFDVVVASLDPDGDGPQPDSIDPIAVNA